MKANAPEKVYISPISFEMGEIFNSILTTKSEGDIEYTRTDAFIEKAAEWLKCQDEMVGISFQEDFIERFKDYMEGE